MGGVGMVREFNLGLGSTGLGGMPEGLSMAQLAQLNAAGMNLFNMNVLGMVNLTVMGISTEAQLLAAYIATVEGGFGQVGLGLGAAGLGGFEGLQSGIGGAGAGRGSPGRSGGRSRASAPTASGSSSSNAGNNKGAKKDEEDFDPAVLNDVATWLHSLRLHKYMPNFEGMSGRIWCLWMSRHSRRRVLRHWVRGGKCSRLSRSSGGKWASMIRPRYRYHRPRLVRPRRHRHLPLGVRPVVVVGYPWRE